MEELEPEDVRPLGRLAEEVRRLPQLEVRRQLVVRPEPELPAGCGRSQVSRSRCVREGRLAEPDLVEELRDHAPVSPLDEELREGEVARGVDVERALRGHLVAADVVGLEPSLETTSRRKT